MRIRGLLLGNEMKKNFKGGEAILIRKTWSVLYDFDCKSFIWIVCVIIMVIILIVLVWPLKNLGWVYNMFEYANIFIYWHKKCIIESINFDSLK